MVLRHERLTLCPDVIAIQSEGPPHVRWLCHSVSGVSETAVVKMSFQLRTVIDCTGEVVIPSEDCHRLRSLCHST